MTRLRLAGAGLLLLLVVLGAGWLWGRSGRATIESGYEAATLRLHLFEARSALQEARVDVYGLNFGNASRHLETAKAPLRAGLERVRDDEAAARALEEALRLAGEAQQLANKLDQSANGPIAEAVRQLDVAIAAITPAPPAQ